MKPYFKPLLIAILVGVLLSWLVQLTVVFFCEPQNLYNTMIEMLHSIVVEWKLNVFLGFLTAIPFIAVAVFGVFHLHQVNKGDFNRITRRKTGIVGAWLAVLVFFLFIYIDLFTLPYQKKPFYPGGSNAALIVLYAPKYSFLFMPFGYIIGWGVGKLITKFRKDKRTAKINE
jgi:multidrug efflux pump subunit AcrB